MSKYFTKYLPVEGEIKEGDRYIKQNGDPTVEVSKPLINTQNGDAIGLTHSLWSMPLQKVKLFLCSRDILLGDRYFHDVYHPYPKGAVADTNTKVMNAHMEVANEGEDYDGDWSYTVIGEISPDAYSFVKEGMELGEDEVRRGKIYSNPPKGEYWEIKGPCGHFH